MAGELVVLDALHAIDSCQITAGVDAAHAITISCELPTADE